MHQLAANFVACCAPPLAVALAMLIAPKKFTDEDRSGIPGCFAGALCMITEFAIPYAAKNIKYIPCFMVGSAAGAVISYLWGNYDPCTSWWCIRSIRYE